jgi:hypothetical protein
MSGKVEVSILPTCSIQEILHGILTRGSPESDLSPTPGRIDRSSL